MKLQYVVFMWLMIIFMDTDSLCCEFIGEKEYSYASWMFSLALCARWKLETTQLCHFTERCPLWKASCRLRQSFEPLGYKLSKSSCSCKCASTICRDCIVSNNPAYMFSVQFYRTPSVSLYSYICTSWFVDCWRKDGCIVLANPHIYIPSVCNATVLSSLLCIGWYQNRWMVSVFCIPPVW